MDYMVTVMKSDLGGLKDIKVTEVAEVVVEKDCLLLRGHKLDDVRGMFRAWQYVMPCLDRSEKPDVGDLVEVKFDDKTITGRINGYDFSESGRWSFLLA